MDRTTVAAGCFLGIEDAFRAIPGVVATRPGYATINDASIRNEPFTSAAPAVIEAVEVEFTPTVVTYQRLLEHFWHIHDPTLGPDDHPRAARRYSSALLPHSEQQRADALASLTQEQTRRNRFILTIISLTWTFSPTELDHGDNEHFALQLTAGERTAFAESGDASDLNLGTRALSPTDLIASLPALPPIFANSLAAIDPLLGGSRSHWTALLSSLSNWLPTTPWTQGQRSAQRSMTIMYRPLALQTEVWSAIDGAELDFIVPLKPGNFNPSQQASWAYTACDAQDSNSFRDVEAIGAGRRRRGPDNAETIPQVRLATEQALNLEQKQSWRHYLSDADMQLKLKNGDTHLIRWHHGNILLADHPTEDIDPELTLQALGGDACICLAVLQAWDARWASQAWSQTYWFLPWLTELRHTAHTATVALANDQTIGGAYPPLRRITMPAHLRETSDPWPVDAGNITRSDRKLVQRHFLQLVQSLPPAFRFRWAIEAATGLAHHRHQLAANDRTLLQMCLFEPLRLTALNTLWQWCRFDASIKYGQLELRFLEDGEAPMVSGYIDQETRMTLGTSFQWFTDVWLRGLACIDGRFICSIDAAPPSATAVRCLAAHWEELPGGARVVTDVHTASWRDGDWHIY